MFFTGRLFKYLGSSNSQLRDHGAYFYCSQGNLSVSVSRKRKLKKREANKQKEVEKRNQRKVRKKRCFDILLETRKLTKNCNKTLLTMFFDEKVWQITEIRRELGDFRNMSIPKLMARLGQCFTQAKVRKSRRYAKS